MLLALVAGALAGSVSALLLALLSKRFPSPSNWRLGLLAAGTLLMLPFFRGVLIGIFPSLRPPSAAERALSRDPAMSLLAARHPAFKAAYTAFLDSIAREDPSYDEAYARGVALGRSAAGQYFRMYLPLAADSSLYAFAKVTVHMLNDLADNPAACIYFLYGPQVAGERHTLQLSSATQAALASALESVVRTGITEPHSPIPKDVGALLMRDLVDSITVAYGSTVAADLALLASSTTASASPERACAAATALYTAIARSAPPRASSTLRYLFASATTQ